MAERDDLILVIAEALDCFWNAAIGAAHARGDFDAMSTATVVSQGVAAVSARLREIAAEREVAAADRIERLERALRSIALLSEDTIGLRDEYIYNTATAALKGQEG